MDGTSRKRFRCWKTGLRRQNPVLSQKSPSKWPLRLEGSEEILVMILFEYARFSAQRNVGEVLTLHFPQRSTWREYFCGKYSTKRWRVKCPCLDATEMSAYLMTWFFQGDLPVILASEYVVAVILGSAVFSWRWWRVCVRKGKTVPNNCVGCLASKRCVLTKLSASVR